MTQETDHRWPSRPYKGLSNYGPEDVALFAGRDVQVSRFARLLTRSDVRLLMLHGPSGCGKSSFLRAGVIPFLEQRDAGVGFVKNPEDPAIRVGSPNAAAVFVRSTGQPLRQLATEVFRLAQKGYVFVSAVGPDRLELVDARRGCETCEEFVSLVLANPLDLLQSLESLASELPLKLVLILDQAEEVITLRDRRTTDPETLGFFAFLNAFARSRWPLDLVVSLRTEFYGVFLNRLRRQSREDDYAPVHDFFLDELGRSELIDAVLRPTLTTPIRGAGVPRDIYQFSFEEGLAEKIVDDLIAAADDEGLVSGTLPFLQIICESLYKKAKERTAAPPWVIAAEDYKTEKVVDMMGRYIDAVLDAFLRRRTAVVDMARSYWKDVLANFTKTQVDGSITTAMLSVSEIEVFADRVGAKDVVDMLNHLALDEQSILRSVVVAEAETTDRNRYCLRHDVIGLVLSAWRSERQTINQQLVLRADELRRSMPRVEKIELLCEFNESGSGSHVRRWLALSSQQTIVDFQIPYGFRVEAHSRVLSPPEGLVRAVEQPSRSVLPVRFIETHADATSLRGRIEVTGQLGPNTGYVGFEIRQPFEHGFKMTRLEAEETYRGAEWTTEYTGVYISMPTGKLHLSIQFPAVFDSPKLEAGPVVFFGSGEKRHDAETARIRPNFRLDGTLATLIVDEPVPGLQYAVYWMPPV